MQIIIQLESRMDKQKLNDNGQRNHDLFLHFFACRWKDPDPDPRGPKTYGSYQCCGSGMFTPDPGSRVEKIPGSRSASKNLSF
jgi:hypothetical protein